MKSSKQELNKPFKKKYICTQKKKISLSSFIYTCDFNSMGMKQKCHVFMYNIYFMYSSIYLDIFVNNFFFSLSFFDVLKTPKERMSIVMIIILWQFNLLFFLNSFLQSNRKKKKNKRKKRTKPK